MDGGTEDAPGSKGATNASLVSAFSTARSRQSKAGQSTATFGDISYEEPTLEARVRTPPIFDRAVFGSGSVFELNIPSKNAIPYKVPVRLYLEEVLIGVYGYCATGAGQGASSSSRAGSNDCSPARSSPDAHQEPAKTRVSRERFERLKAAVEDEAAVPVAQALFWLSIGLIFNRVQSGAMNELRSQLANAWHLMGLAVQTQVPTNQQHRDELLSAMTVVMVQTVYRLMVDAFGSVDKNMFVQQPAKVIEKVTNIMNFEVLGFQPSAKTNLNARRRIFRKFVLDFPFINQREREKNKARTKMLEGDSTRNSDLKFGQLDGGNVMDDLQLEHVMLGRKQEQQRKKSVSPRSPVLDSTQFPGMGDEEDYGLPLASRQLAEHMARLQNELNVDRYSEFGPNGLEMFKSHLLAIDPDRDDELDEFGEEGATPPGTAELEKSLTRELSDVLEEAVDSAGAGDNPVSPPNRRTLTRRHTLVATHSRRKELEMAETKRRQELLKKHVEHDQLPSQLMQTTLNTTWVSPAVDRLAPGDRPRLGLKKAASESRMLKMSPPKAIMALPPIISRRGDDHAARDTASSHGGSASAAVATGAASPLFKQVASAEVVMKPGGKCGSGQMPMSLVPPPHLPTQLVLKRLESQLQGFHQKSFHTYAQEYDLYTGFKKQRMDPEELHHKETRFVSEFDKLLGGHRSEPMRHSKYGVGGSRSRDQAASRSAPTLPPV